MNLKLRLLTTLLLVLGYTNIHAQKTDSTSKFIMMRTVECSFIGLKPVIYIFEGEKLTEIDLKFVKKEKEIFKLIASKINEILLRGYKIVSSTTGAGSADTMNSYLITTYIFEKL